MKKSHFVTMLVSLATLPLLGADTVVEQIIARVNNSIITRSDYLRSEEQLKDEIKQQDPSHFDKVYADKKRDVLRDLIDQQLLLEKGKDLGITADTELIKKLDEMRKQMNLGTMEELEKAAEAQGVSYEDFKQNMRNQIITQQVMGREVGSHLNITKEEEQKFYDEHKNEMEQPEQIRLSEILVSTQKSAPAPAAVPDPSKITDPTSQAVTPAAVPSEEDQLAAAKAKANDLLDQIKKGTAFEEVAKNNSDGPTAAQSGDLGLFKRGTLSKELEDLTFAMKAGDVSDVRLTKQGFVILKVTEHQMAGLPTLKQMEPRIQDALYYQKLQPALRVYLKKLREEAYIDIPVPGYVDTGQSPNQTKPVETAGKEAAAKKLKKKKKHLLF
ncbi:MAG TPA: peptidylprolyl isomerase [Terriglobales bacterium]|jgi:peptidyl-prolyl cis-trans isomerase SurA|nr:peptidylprolyl isomerase [Terriglobales bacterium]